MFRSSRLFPYCLRVVAVWVRFGHFGLVAAELVGDRMVGFGWFELFELVGIWLCDNAERY
jgi:hypothetical protein